MPDIIENFEAMLASGTDNTLLRYGLGNAYLQKQDFEKAAEHLAEAVALDPDYSAAWKLYGKALAESSATEAAMDAYRAGIEVAERKGDVQAAKEMRVFLKRLEKTL